MNVFNILSSISNFFNDSFHIGPIYVILFLFNANISNFYDIELFFLSHNGDTSLILLNDKYNDFISFRFYTNPISYISLNDSLIAILNNIELLNSNNEPPAHGWSNIKIVSLG